MIRPVNAVYMHRSDIDFTDCRRSERDERVTQLCESYVMTLEKYCMWFPNQWYNFFDFWKEGE